MNRQDILHPVPKIVHQRQQAQGYPPFLQRAQSQQGFQPKFLGIIKLLSPHTGKLQEYIVMRNESAYFENPNIIDIKIGKRSWDDIASTKKIIKEQNKYKEQNTIGFRIVGMKIFDINTQKYKQYTKEFGQSLHTEKNINDALKLFFSDNTKAILTVHKYLKELEICLVERPAFHFFSSSQLIVYGFNEKKIQKKKLQESQNEIPQQPGIKNFYKTYKDSYIRILMIDFAHTYPCLQNEDWEYFSECCINQPKNISINDRYTRWGLQKSCLPKAYEEWIDLHSNSHLIEALKNFLKEIGQECNLHNRLVDDNYLFGLRVQQLFVGRFDNKIANST